MKVVIESPLSAPTSDGFRENFRFLLWCCRAMWLEERIHALGSHMLNPWFMDDHVPDERAAGIDNPWVWEPGVAHAFFTDLGTSGGMTQALARCLREDLQLREVKLKTYSPQCWDAFERGEWPPHTPGFNFGDSK